MNDEIKELNEKVKEIREELHVFIQKNSVETDETILGTPVTSFTLNTIEDVQYYQSLLDKEKELQKLIHSKYDEYLLLKSRINTIKEIKKNINEKS